MPSSKKRKAKNISTEHGNNENGNGAGGAAGAPAPAPKSAAKKNSKTKRAKAPNAPVRRSSLKGPGALPRGLPLHWANARGGPLGFASHNFSAASAVAHDPSRITKPSSTRRNNEGRPRMYNVPKLIAHLSDPSLRYLRSREDYMNYVIAFIQEKVSTTEEMIAAIKGLPDTQFTPLEKYQMLQKLSRSYKAGNFSEPSGGEGGEE